MKKFLLFSLLLTISFGLVAQTKSKSKSRKTSNQVRTEMHECNWCSKQYSNRGYYLGPQDKKVQKVGDVIEEYRTSIWASGYKWFCSAKCGMEYYYNH
jgi:hypothetical protein